MRIFTFIRDQIPRSSARVCLDVVQFLLNEFVVTAFLPIKRRLKYFVYFAPLPVCCIHEFSQLCQYSLLTFDFQSLHHSVRHETLALAYD